MKPGEIYWADLPDGRRPVIAVSREDLNRGKYVVVVLCTTIKYALRSTLPSCVPFKAGEYGLPYDCVAQGETITFLQKDAMDIGAGIIGTLDDIRMRALVHALGHVLDSDCEPN
jgi:mRNA-degrading endonuclease toxin of MazEF toxin-antitoxin module